MNLSFKFRILFYNANIYILKFICILLFNFRSETSIGNPSYKVYMFLTIHSISAMDFGLYRCVAKNPRGETDGSIRLYGKCDYIFIILYNILYILPIVQ